MEVYENPAAILAYLLGFDAFRELLDYYHACLYIQQLADALFGPSPKGWAWAKQMRKHLTIPLPTTKS